VETTGYRKAALERLSSPEQLDEALRVSASREWAATIAIFLVLGSVGVWAMQSSLPAKAAGRGVLIRTGGLLTVATLKGGRVLSIEVGVGDRVEPNQVVARVAQPALLDRIAATRLQLAQAKGNRTQAIALASSNAALQAEAIRLQRENARREIAEFEVQAKLAADQIPVVDQLLAKGLVTTQQTIAARQQLVTIQQQIAARQALIKQHDAEEFAARAQPRQTDAERLEAVRHIEMQLASLEKELELSLNVVSPYGGEVVEMKVDAGSVISAEAPLMTIQPGARQLDVMVCVPSQAAKNIAVGMMAEVSPSTVKREEFGFVRGRVSYVANYPATSAALMRILQNEQLVRSLTADGPVTEVRIKMDADADSPSGFRWSSSRGPALTLSSGTLATVEIITRQQRPIELLLPYAKKTLGVN
jgi:HlyD family secretion protein